MNSRALGHTRDAIKAHLTIVLAALALARYLQDATGMSSNKIVNTRAAAATSHRTRRRPRTPAPDAPTAETILDSLDLNAQ